MKLQLNRLALIISTHLAIPVLCHISPMAYATGVTEKITTSEQAPSNLNPGGHDPAYLSPTISGDGRYVLYNALLDLLPGDSNGKSDTYLYDRQTKQTSLISVASNGTQQVGFGSVDAGSISADGRYVAFGSYANNLVSGDTNGMIDVFVHDRQTKQTKRVSVASNGSQAMPNPPYSSSAGTSVKMSSDARFVAFVSGAANLVPGDTNNNYDIFLHDQQTGQTTRVNVGSNGEQDDSLDFPPVLSDISADGRYIFFASLGNTLAANDTNPSYNDSMFPIYDSFVHDRVTHQTSLIGVNTHGDQSNVGNSVQANSADGRYVVIAADAVGSNLAATGDLTHTLFLRDRQTQQTSTLKAYYNGVDILDSSHALQNHVFGINADGRYITFTHADKTHCVDSAGVDSGCYLLTDVFVLDRLTSQATLVSSNINETYSYSISCAPMISADGRYVSFSSLGTNFLTGTAAPSQAIYVRDLLADPLQQANLKVATTAQPASLAPAGTGAYTYTISNTSAKAQPVNLLHLVSKGLVTHFTPSQGKCRRYATTSLCNFGKVPAHGSVTLKANVKVNANQLRQKVVVSSKPIDSQPANNSVHVTTPVK